MTVADRSALPSSSTVAVVLEPGRVLVIAVVTGLALGLGDLWALSNLSPGVSDAINSCRGWASAVLVLGFLLRTHPAWAALGGAVMMLAAVESYYVFKGDLFAPDLSAWDSLSAQYWSVIGVPTGLLFGVLGAWARLGVRRLREL
jgi:hypothetical protein